MGETNTTPPETLVPNPKLRLREQVGKVMRFKHYSWRTEESYWQWICRYIFFHRKRHPKEMGAAEVRVFCRIWTVRKAWRRRRATRCGIRSRRTCWRMVTTSARRRIYWGTRMFRRRRFTRTSCSGRALGRGVRWTFEAVNPSSPPFSPLQSFPRILDSAGALRPLPFSSRSGRKNP